MWIATAEQSRDIDRRAVEEFGIPVRVLMERAGLAVFEAVRELLPSGRISVLCGKGHNGGDGFAVARLAQESGFYRVECLVACREADLTPGAREQMTVARAARVEPIFADDERFPRRLEGLCCQELIVDALLGTGARGDVEGPIRTAIQAGNRSGVPIIAVDIPSGIHADTGEELGDSIWAMRTIVMGLPKPFLFQGAGLERSGFWTVADIGIPSELVRTATKARLMRKEWVAARLPERMRASHKGQNGHVLIVAGSRTMPGAAVLSARAALRAGAGLVTVASIEKVCDVVSRSLPEALLLPLPEENGALGSQAAHALIEKAASAHAAIFGPGLTHGDGVQACLGKVWESWPKPCVIDADALNAVAHGVQLPHAPTVLTPHPGEMSRLLKLSIAEVQADRFQSCEMAVKEFERTFVLKGAYSLIASPEEPILVNSTGNPGMASGGMGDALSGVIATLLAQEVALHEAAACGAYWHGEAGDLAAQQIGTTGFLASEVADFLPQARLNIVTA
jgi:hydroxyethylthiazole kinase-like uncharacterized protein yjeF